MDIIMNKDIVSEMVTQMGLTPQMVQDQGAGGYMHQPYPQHGGQYNNMPPSLPSTAEEQMRLLNAAQSGVVPHTAIQQDAVPQGTPQQGVSFPQFAAQEERQEAGSGDEESAGEESEINLDQIGMGQSKSTIDTIMDYLKDPIVLVILYVILNLPQVDTLIKNFLPSLLTNTVYYYIAIKGLILGFVYLLIRLILA